MTSPALDTALAAAVHSEVFLVRIEFPNGTMRLATSPGSMVWDGETYVGGSPTDWGGLISVGNAQEGAGGQAQQVAVVLALTATVRTAVYHPTMQGSRVDMWRGLRSLTGPDIIGMEPVMVAGFVSTATVRGWQDTRVAELLCVSHQERRFIPQAGRVHTTAFRQTLSAGDLFEEFAAGTAAVGSASTIGVNLAPGGGGGGVATRAVGKLVASMPQSA